MENNRKLLLPRVLETGRVPQPMRFGIMGSGLNFCLIDCFVGLAFAGCVEEA